MRRLAALHLVVVLFAASRAALAPAQTPTPSAAQSVPAATSPQLQKYVPTLTTGTQLVVVDVVVQDRDGHPVHGLKLSDFHLDESKSPQTIRTFDEHSATDVADTKRPPLPQLPPGTFTNYTPVPPNGTLNILLLDTLNTVTKDQSYVRAQLRKFVQQADPSTRIAIFGLTARLTLLQSFTSDPAILKAAVEMKGRPKPSALLDDPNGDNSIPEPLSADIANQGFTGSSMASIVGQAVTDLQQFEADRSAFQTNIRTRYTLDAFNQLARYLSAFPGRKNLIWFSGSFPISIQPNPDLDNPYHVTYDNAESVRETTNLLTRARVAVYPVDARETLNAPVFASANTGVSSSREALPGAQDDIRKFGDDQMNAVNTMEQMAGDTGGHAFYDGRPLIDSVKQSIEAGSNYYTLTYSPTNRDWKGEYRTIRVQLQGEAVPRNLKLSYRHGYYADDPNDRRKAKSTSILSANSAVANTPQTGSSAYAYAAMRRGAPAPSEVVFEVRVLPHSTAVEDKVAPHNSPNPNGSFKGPFRTFDLDIVTVPRNFQLTPQADGQRHGTVEYVTYVYDTDGHLLNTDSATIALGLTPDNYAKLSASGLGFRQQISVPAKGESFLRIAVHDIPSGRFGAVEVPISSVIHLAPAPAP